VRENFKRGKLGKSKEVTLGLRVFDYSSLGLGNIKTPWRVKIH